MNCPQCAEAIGIKAWLKRAQRCPHCGSALETDEAGALMDWARVHGAALLAAPRPMIVWVLCGLGLTAAVIGALVPTAGVLPVVLFLVQSACLVRATQRFREHFTLAHTLTVDFYSSFALTALLVGQGLANALMGPGALAISAPLFLAVWFGVEAYVRWHFGRMVRGQGPSAPESAVLMGLLALVVVPPTILFVAVLAGSV
jgi:hypothetical protein